MHTATLPSDEAAVRTTSTPVETGATVIVGREDLQALFDALTKRGYQVWGPTVREGAIIYDKLHSVGDLPEGWTDEQEGGTYRLKRREDNMLFGYASSPQSWKKLLHSPLLRLWQATRENGHIAIENEKEEIPRRAFFGVRSCDLHAIEIQDKVFLGGAYQDPAYKARREGIFTVVVNCGKPAATCFCASMGTGPKAEKGFDLALTEVLDGHQHYFTVEVGTQAGAEVIAEVPFKEAGELEKGLAEQIVENTAANMGRTMKTAGLKEILYAATDHPRWEQVAARCLSCGNCTQVCPTCFCMTVEDVTDLTATKAERWRRWDSCFTLDFSYIHGGSVRPSTRARYRQWLTHKLSSWHDQFGTSGCVGCGRCITWCPVGIDITEEVRAIRGQDDTPVTGDQWW